MNDQDEFKIIVSSRDSRNFFPENNIHEFTYSLAKPLHLDATWRLALVELIHPPYEGSLEIRCDKVRPISNTNGGLPLLAHVGILCPQTDDYTRRIHVIENPLYIPINTIEIDRIKFTVSARELLDSEIILTLCFKKFEAMTNKAIVLDSADGVSNIYYEENKPYNFVCILPKRLELREGEWEVALTGLSFTATQTKMRKGEMTQKFETEGFASPQKIQFVYDVTKTHEEFVRALNLAIADWSTTDGYSSEQLPEFEYKNDTIVYKKYGMVRKGDRTHQFRFVLDEAARKWMEEGPKATWPTADLIHVTCDSVTPSMVGPSFLKTLRLVCINRDASGSFTAHIHHPCYVRVPFTKIRAIGIELLDNKLTHLPLPEGRTIVQLDLRQRAE